MAGLDDDAPTRRDFEYLSSVVRELTQEIRTLRSDIAATYVRKDVYAEAERGHERTHIDHEKEIASLNRARNAVINLVLGGVGTAALGLILTMRWWA